MKEKTYRETVHSLSIVAMLMSCGIMYLTHGAGDVLEELANVCYNIALIVLIINAYKGIKYDRRERRRNNIADIELWIDSPSTLSFFRNTKFFYPIKRNVFLRTIDKLRGIMYLSLYTHIYDGTNVNSTFKFPVTEKQLFNLKLKGLVEFENPMDVPKALKELNVELKV